MAKTKKFPQVRYTQQLCTLNNYSKWGRFSKAEIKNTYKELLKDMIIPEPAEVYTTLTINYRLIRHNNTRLDKDNIVFALKWIADTLEELDYIKDDKIVNFHSFETIVDSTLPETMFEIQVTTDELKWTD